MNSLRSWSSDSIPQSRWKKATMWKKKTVQELKNMYAEAKRQSLRRLRRLVCGKRRLHIGSMERQCQK